jgi:hypothetical protein
LLFGLWRAGAPVVPADDDGDHNRTLIVDAQR